MSVIDLSFHCFLCFFFSSKQKVKPLFSLFLQTKSSSSSMEDMVKHSKTASPPLTMHKDSHMISKLKPKIRIVHLLAPPIIKTDAANFRELVQRLTGKPTEQQPSMKRAGKTKREDSWTMKAVEYEDGYQNSGCFERTRGEEEQEVEKALLGGANSNGFFNRLGDLDGFIQGYGQFPSLALDNAASQVDVYGDAHPC